MYYQSTLHAFIPSATSMHSSHHPPSMHSSNQPPSMHSSNQSPPCIHPISHLHAFIPSATSMHSSHQPPPCIHPISHLYAFIPSATSMHSSHQPPSMHSSPFIVLKGYFVFDCGRHKQRTTLEEANKEINIVYRSTRKAMSIC